jgi:glutamate dehydrogenase
LELVPGGLDIVEMNTVLKRSLPLTARVHFQLGAELGLDELRTAIDALDAKSHWQAVARTSLGEELHRLHRTLTENVLRQRRGGHDAARLTNQWLANRQRSVEHFQGIRRDIEANSLIDFPTLSVALQSLRRLVGS